MFSTLIFGTYVRNSFVRSVARKHSTKAISKSGVTDHARQLNHVMDWDSAKIVAREADCKLRGIKEAITIRRVKENMNRDEGDTHSPISMMILSTHERETRYQPSQRGGASPLFAATAPPYGNTSDEGIPDIGSEN